MKDEQKIKKINLELSHPGRNAGYLLEQVPSQES